MKKLPIEIYKEALRLKHIGSKVKQLSYQLVQLDKKIDIDTIPVEDLESYTKEYSYYLSEIYTIADGMMAMNVEDSDKESKHE